MNEVFVLSHEIKDGVGLEIIGVYGDVSRAVKAWGFYLDAIEKKWREAESVGLLNTFNRFSEPSGNSIAFTSLERQEEGVCHYITVTRYDLE